MAEFHRVSPSTSSRSLSPSPSPSPSTSGGRTIAEDSLFVAVTRDINDSKSVLRWALENRNGSGICVIHIHQPDKHIPTPLGKIPVKLANKNQIEAHRVTERKKLSKKLEEHLQFCRQYGVVAEKIYVEMDSIQDGIVMLITDQNIRKLVMGAAVDKRYTKDMIEILSEKAKYVRQHSPDYCHIWFICKKLLIYTREASENSARFEGIERLRSAPSFEISGLLDAQSSFVGDEMARTFSSSTYRSSLSGPSAPDLVFSQVVTVGQQEIDAWLLTQHVQQPSDMNPFGFKNREAGLEEPEKVKEELQIALVHISAFKSRIEMSDLLIEQLTETVEKYKKERDEMQLQRDNAIKEVEEAREKLKEGSSSFVFPMINSELPFQDIEKATNKFDQSMKLEEDAYRIIYKGSFDIQLAVKIPHPSTLLAPQEFRQEVEMMNNLRHPNIVNLIGACSESQALIYQHCTNGNLEDHISLKAENSPLKWQTRIKIATELCNVLMYLHSHKPQPIIHGDIRAGNIHLDSHFTCKLNNFSTSIAILSGKFSLENRAIAYANIDPEYFATEEITTRSDVYSFGIVLLRLLTGKLAMKLVREVQKAVELDELSGLVDVSAEWPIEQAKLLADLALRCCEMTRDRRPDLDPDVWKALVSIKEFVKQKFH